MGQIVLEPEPKTSRCWSWSQKFRCLELEPEIWVPAPQAWLMLSSYTAMGLSWHRNRSPGSDGLWYYRNLLHFFPPLSLQLHSGMLCALHRTYMQLCYSIMVQWVISLLFMIYDDYHFSIPPIRTFVMSWLLCAFQFHNLYCHALLSSISCACLTCSFVA